MDRGGSGPVRCDRSRGGIHVAGQGGEQERVLNEKREGGREGRREVGTEGGEDWKWLIEKRSLICR